MGILTPFFNLFKPAKTDPAAVEKFNENMDIIDTEMHRPPLTINGIQPDPTSRNTEITTVPLADNLTSDEAQINTGTYIIRSSGGEASIKDGSAMLSEIRGNMVKTGAVAQSVVMNVSGEDIQDTEIDETAFIAAVTPASGTMVFSYTNAWNVNPELYGITVVGTPASGDSITVVYTKANRGTITVANPVTFISTGWNLYNNVTGYARVCRYSEEYDFKISGEYTSIAFADTPAGAQTPISPVDGHFSLPTGKDRGYIIVTGGNATDTAIWMAWGDWTEQANGGTFEPYTQTQIDLSEVMTLFPYGLMKVGNVSDEINLNTGRAYSRVQRLAYTEANLENVIASGVEYDTDANYIYAAMEFPASYAIELDGEYTVSDHGTEIFSGTTVAVTASSLYGNDLKGKLRRDVLTISQQTLTDAQKAQVLQNIGAASSADALTSGSLGTYTVDIPYTVPANGSWNTNTKTAIDNAKPTGARVLGVVGFITNSSNVVPISVRYADSNYALQIKNTSNSEVSNNVKLHILYVR
jgi:hypothetical protein